MLFGAMMISQRERHSFTVRESYSDDIVGKRGGLMLTLCMTVVYVIAVLKTPKDGVNEMDLSGLLIAGSMDACLLCGLLFWHPWAAW